MIELSKVKKSFGGISVLDDINLNIMSGQIFGLAGRSGAGKSTLLRCINGLEDYDEGSLKVDGVELKTLNNNEKRKFRKNIGMIFQQFSLLTQLNVFQNVALPLSCWGYKRKYTDEKVKQLLDMVEISEKTRAYPSQLSGGQKQRVAIARALSLNPRILLCDEATSALDPKTADSILDLLRQINRQMGITIIVVAHQMPVIRSLCHRMAVIEDGRIMANGNVEDIFIEEPPALKNLMGADKIMRDGGESRNLKVILMDEMSRTPVFSRISRELGVDIVMVSGETNHINDRDISSFIINIPCASAETVQRYLTDHQITFKIIPHGNNKNKNGETADNV